MAGQVDLASTTCELKRFLECPSWIKEVFWRHFLEKSPAKRAWEGVCEALKESDPERDNNDEFQAPIKLKGNMERLCLLIFGDVEAVYFSRL